MGLSKTQEKEYAKILYVNEKLTQKEIAERVGVSPKTLGKWIVDGKWDKLRQSMLTQNEHNLELMYQTLTALNESLVGKIATSAQLHSIAELVGSIKNLQTDLKIDDILEVGKRFMNFVRVNYPEKLQKRINFSMLIYNIK